MTNGSASRLTGCSPAARASRIERRVGSAMASYTESGIRPPRRSSTRSYVSDALPVNSRPPGQPGSHDDEHGPDERPRSIADHEAPTLEQAEPLADEDQPGEHDERRGSRQEP